MRISNTVFAIPSLATLCCLRCDHQASALSVSLGQNQAVSKTSEGAKTRREFFSSSSLNSAAAALVVSVVLPSRRAVAAAPNNNNHKRQCTDIESCREIGERKDAEDLAANPIVKLGDGLEYKVLKPGAPITDNNTVNENSKVKIIYSISQATGSYMYSKGFGYNKVDAGGGMLVNDDQGLDSLLIDMKNEMSPSSTLEQRQIPVGISKAMMGMRRGERRRIVCPPKVGFETSNWNPQPVTFRGKQQIKDYQNTLYGRGDTQPPFLAPTLWDVEIVSIR